MYMYYTVYRGIRVSVLHSMCTVLDVWDLTSTVEDVY